MGTNIEMMECVRWDFQDSSITQFDQHPLYSWTFVFLVEDLPETLIQVAFLMLGSVTEGASMVLTIISLATTILNMVIQMFFKFIRMVEIRNSASGSLRMSNALRNNKTPSVQMIHYNDGTESAPTSGSVE